MSIHLYLQELEDRLAIASETQKKHSQALDEVAASLVFLREAMEEQAESAPEIDHERKPS